MTTAFLGFCQSLLITTDLPFEPSRYKQDVISNIALLARQHIYLHS